MHGRTEELHPEDVQTLALDVEAAHVDLDRQAERGADDRGRDPVLARPGLGDQPALAHGLCEQGLPERVVQLVRPAVEEVLALEVDPAPEVGREPGREGQRGRAARVLGEQAVESGREAGVGPMPVVGRLELEHGLHQGLGHVPAAETAESSIARHTARSSSSALRGLGAHIRAEPIRNASQSGASRRRSAGDEMPLIEITVRPSSRSSGERRGSRREVDPERGEIPVVDADEPGVGAERELDLGLRLDLDERLEPGLAGQVDERGEPVSEDFRHQEDRVAAERPGLRELPLVDDELLAEERVPRRHSGAGPGGRGRPRSTGARSGPRAQRRLPRRAPAPAPRGRARSGAGRGPGRPA